MEYSFFSLRLNFEGSTITMEFSHLVALGHNVGAFKLVFSLEVVELLSVWRAPYLRALRAAAVWVLLVLAHGVLFPCVPGALYQKLH